MGRDRLQRALRGDAVDRPAWLPLPSAFLGRLGSLSYSEITTDAGHLFGAVTDVVSLLAADSAVVLPDSTLLAEAAGAAVVSENPHAVPRLASHPWANHLPTSPPRDIPARGRLGVALETYRRLRVSAPQFGLAFAITGPGLLATQARGRAFIEDAAGGQTGAEDCLDIACQIVLEVITAAGEIGGEMIVVLEAMLPGHARRYLAEAWGPLVNLGKFYGLPILAVPSPAVSAFEYPTSGVLPNSDLGNQIGDLNPWGYVRPVIEGAELGLLPTPNEPVPVPGLTDVLISAGTGRVRAGLQRFGAADARVLSTAIPLTEASSLSGLLEVRDWLGDGLAGQ